MANPHKGEVAFDADGKIYTLRYSANALCELEDHLGKGMGEIMQEIQAWTADPSKLRLNFVRAVFWAGLRDEHPEIDIKEAGKLITAAGGIATAAELIGKGFERAFPAPETKGADPQKPAPEAAAGGTG